MGNFGALEIGKRALLANRLGLDVTSNNVANVNTAGYSRRVATFSQSDSRQTSNGFVGTGSVMDKLRSSREELFDREIRKNVSRNTGYATDEQLMKQISSIFSESGDYDIGTLTTSFFNSFEDLASKPQDIGLRTNVISKAKALVDAFHNTASNLNELRANILTDMKSNVTKANDYITRIATLNNQIATTKAQGGDEAINLVDEREKLLEDLSGLADVNVTTADAGMVNVYINGINVVTGATSSKLQLVEKINSLTGEKSAQIYNLDQNGNQLYNITPQSGELFAQSKQYNITLDNLDSSGDYSVAKNLDALANALVNKVNNITISGYGLNDAGPLPPGRNFFEPATGMATALNIDISSAIINNPENIPISDTINEPGNNKIALQLANLGTDTGFITGVTANSYYANLIGKMGTLEGEAVNGKNTTKLIAEQLTNQRESLIGVNMDEEAVSLIKFQKAFDASSRIISAANDMLGTIINLGR